MLVAEVIGSMPLPLDREAPSRNKAFPGSSVWSLSPAFSTGAPWLPSPVPCPRPRSRPAPSPSSGAGSGPPGAASPPPNQRGLTAPSRPGNERRVPGPPGRPGSAPAWVC